MFRVMQPAKPSRRGFGLELFEQILELGPRAKRLTEARRQLEQLRLELIGLFALCMNERLALVTCVVELLLVRRQRAP